MAIATGTAAVIGAGLTAAGVIGSSKVQSNAANRATKAQLTANDQAMAYQREQDAKLEAEKEQRRSKYLQAARDWYGLYGDEGIKRYGIPRGLTLADLKGGGKGGADVKAAGNGYSVVQQPMAKRPTIADLGAGMQGLAGPEGSTASMQPYAQSVRMAMAPEPGLSPAAVAPPDVPRRRQTLADLSAFGA